MIQRTSARVCLLATCASTVFCIAAIATAAEPPLPSGGALAGDRPRLIVSTDVGGSDPDDFQSMVHLLDYADLWWIESDTTFRGMYVGGVQKDGWDNRGFVAQHVQGHGAMGDLFFNKKRGIKMGDTPSLLFLLRGDPDDPTTQHWGGAYMKTEHGAHHWTDHPDPSLAEAGRAGAKTVNRWRVDDLADWRRRMTWALKP